MTYRMTDRAAAATIKKTYRCDDCDCTFRREFASEAEVVTPDCPNCAVEAGWVPPLVGLKTNASRAVDYAYQTMEETYGFTDMKDNLREGDIAAPAPPPVQTSEAEMLTMAVKQAMPELTEKQAEGVKNFWQQGVSREMEEAAVNAARPASQLARADGSDPIKMLHEGEKATGGRMRLEVVGAAKASDVA